MAAKDDTLPQRTARLALLAWAALICSCTANPPSRPPPAHGAAGSAPDDASAPPGDATAARRDPSDAAMLPEPY